MSSSAPAAVALPRAAEPTLTREQERFYFASQWRLIWWRLRKHRLAMVSFWILAILYAAIPFVEFLSPYALRARHAERQMARVHSSRWRTVHTEREGRRTRKKREEKQ